MDCSPPGSSVHGVSQARVLEWVTISFSRRSSWPRDWTQAHHVISAGKRRRRKEKRHRKMGLEGEPCLRNHQGQEKVLYVFMLCVEHVWIHLAHSAFFSGTLRKMNNQLSGESENISLCWVCFIFEEERESGEGCTLQNKFTVDKAPSAESIMARQRFSYLGPTSMFFCPHYTQPPAGYLSIQH